MKISSAQLIALRAARGLRESSRRIAQTLGVMSSGSNDALMDSARLSSAHWLNTKIRAIVQENKNANLNTARSQTALSGLESQRELLGRMRELAIRAANGSLSQTDRANLQVELSSLLEELNRISSETKWNDEQVLIDSNSSNLFTKTVGAGTSTQSTNLSPGSTQYGEVVADFNNDGNMDIAQNDGQDWLLIRLGNGDGSFQAAITATEVTGEGSYLVAGDINQDGILDLVSNSATNTEVQYFIGYGDGRFSAGATFSQPASAVDLGDYDGDGELEIFATNGGQYGIYKWSGSGFSLWRSGTSLASSSFGLANQDFNNDGFDDLVVRQVGSALLSVLLGDGNGAFAQSATLLAVNYGAISADFNGDGNMDLLGQNNAGTVAYIYLGDGLGNFTLTDSLAAGAPTWTSIAQLLDYNGDGLLDVIAMTSSNLSIFLGEGGGTFSDVRTMSIGYNASSLMVADFDNDGVDDFTASIKFLGSTSYLFRTNTRERSALSDIDLSTVESAQGALEIIGSAQEKILTHMNDWNLSNLEQELKIDSNLLLQESLESARSNITEPDYALLTANLVQEQIQQKALLAVMAQANIQMQAILELLKA